jgi:hypothetical protein
VTFIKESEVPRFAREERIVASFEEIQRFFEKHDCEHDTALLPRTEWCQ